HTGKKSRLSPPKSTGHRPPDPYVRLPCGHLSPPDYLLAWCQFQLEQGRTVFGCPQCGDGLAGRTGLSYQLIAGKVSLSDRQKRYFEETVSRLTALTLCDFKPCPGCGSFVERIDLNNLCVHCTICTAKKARTYQFCWLCLKEWTGPFLNAKHCANSGCGQKVQEQEITPSFTFCQPEFKSKTLQSEGDDVYPLLDKSRLRRRLALVISNIEFEHLSDRIGGEKDEADMKSLLEILGYSVVILKNLTAQGMNASIKDFSKRKEHIQSDSCFVVIMSHGCAEGICGTHDLPGSEQEDIFKVEEIFKSLNTANCAGLRDKPKVILIQSCRGGECGVTMVPDSAPIRRSQRKEHTEKDFICLRSSTPDTVSYRCPENGSVFIQTIVQVFHQYADENHIEELFRRVLKKFKDSYPDQMPCKDRTTLVKKFYLFPGL
uniref:Uncharacterized protein n=1 Tax=Denticeps clupeoides TaxID=299321 RepID=A0AAY4A857_9TELE